MDGQELDTTTGGEPGGQDAATAARLAKLRAARPPSSQASGLPRRSRRAALSPSELKRLREQHLTRPVDLSDTKITGLTARVSPGGGVKFYFRWRVAGGGFRRVTLDAASIDEARDKAGKAKDAAAIGRDPRSTPAARSKATARTVAETVPDYIAALRERGRAAGYVRNVERMFALHVLPHLGRKRLVDLTREDLAGLFSRLRAAKSTKAKGQGGTLTAMVNRVHTQVTALLAWAVQEGRIPPGVAPVVPKPVQLEPSARALKEQTKPELRPEHLARLWLAVEDEPARVRSLVRLLCLLPMRREELTRLSWHEVRAVLDTDNVVTADTDTFGGPRLDIPAGRMKGGRPQVMPLPPEAVAILRSMSSARGARGDYVFSASAGAKPYAGWRTLASRLHATCADMPRGWVVHDLRAGIVTTMGEAGEDEAVIARLLHHSEIARRGVTARYDRSRRLRPMLEALERWQAALFAAVTAEQRRRLGQSATVVPLSKAN